MEEIKFVEGIISDEELTEVSGGAGASKYKIYTVVRGDTLPKLAFRFGTTIDIIMKINCIENPDMLRCGQRLLIPIPI